MSHSRRSIVLIGPDAERYRGGIAQFTSRLAFELAKHGELHFLSWSELYPRFLISRELHEPSSDSGARAHPLLHYSRPWTWFSTASRIAELRPEKIIISWSHPIHAPVYLALFSALRKKTKAEIIGVCHNVLPHEKFPGAKRLTAACFRRLDRIVVHSRSEEKRLAGISPRTETTGAFLPLFDFYPPPQRSARPAPRLLFFGAIRPYKGLDILLRALPLVRNVHPDLKLRIAGENFYRPRNRFVKMISPHADYRPLDLVPALGLEECVEADIRYIPDEEIPQIFSDVDAVIFPFRNASQSASLSLALSMGIPVVAADVGGLSDVVSPALNGQLVEPENPAALAAGILKLLARPPKPSWILSCASEFSWDRYCRLALDGTPQAPLRSVVHG